jgi:hypothetical protein
VWQDWYCGIRKSLDFSYSVYGSQILVLSRVKVEGQRSEVDIYCEALRELGCISPRVIEEGYETIGQIEYAIDLARKENQKLTIFVSFLHYPRVVWICRKCKDVDIDIRPVLGIPRPKEAITDFILIFVYPILDTLFSGFRVWFQNRVIGRREMGIQ